MPFDFPRRYRSPDDDGAPVDYTFSHSVAEGQHRRQNEPIHRKKEEEGIPSIYPRPRDNPFARRAAYVPGRASTLEEAQTQVASVSGQPAAAAGQTAENPLTVRDGETATAPAAVSASAVPAVSSASTASTAVSAASVPAAASAVATSAATPRAPRAGRTREHTAPPSQADDYARAGYPTQLVDDQREQENEERAFLGQGRRTHGAQAAAPKMPAQGYVPAPAPAKKPEPATPAAPQWGRYVAVKPAGSAPVDKHVNTYREIPEEQTTPYTVYQEEPRKRRRGEPEGAKQDADAPDADEPEEDEQNEKPRLRIPILGVAVFAAAAVLIALWVMQVTFTAQKAGVLSARAEAVQSLAESHPFGYRDLIEKEAAANNLNPAFIAAIIFNESSFNPDAVSAVGARGLMQMMPDTAEWVHGKMNPDSDYSFDLMFNPEDNVKYACWYLAYLGNRFNNDPLLVASAFHAGQTTVQNWLNNSLYSADGRSIMLKNLPDGPTKNYSARVLNSFAIYLRLYYEGGLPAAVNAA